MNLYITYMVQHREGLVVNLSASRAVGCGFVPRQSHTKDPS